MSTLIKDFTQKKEIENTLLNEFVKAKEDNIFDELTNQLSLPIEELSKYTSIFNEAKEEYAHCKYCKGILECKNKITGYAFLPREKEGTITFAYQPCKYKMKQEKEMRYLQNITVFGLPQNLINASLDNIYMEDKNRYQTIKWIKNFIETYFENPHQKGLYLHGNFGCGKTYLVAVTLTTLAKKNIKSVMVFWPDFLRELKNSFQNGYQTKIEQIQKVPILCIDDIGAEAATPWGRDEILCPILQYRMQESLPTFFTSNLDIKALEQHFSITKDGVEIVKSRRIIERILQLTEDIEMISKNLR